MKLLKISQFIETNERVLKYPAVLPPFSVFVRDEQKWRP